jgi:hypothetical protein
VCKKEMALKVVKEAIKTPLGITILVTLVVIILLFVLTIIKNTYLEGKPIDYSIIFLALVPFLIYLAVTGKISEIGGGGFWIKFNKASEAEVFWESIEHHIYWSNLVEAKGNIKEFRKRILRASLSTLRINIKEAEKDCFTPNALKECLKELTRYDFFKYVVFLGDIKGATHTFQGYLYARGLLDRLSDESENEPIFSYIQKWNLDKISGVEKSCVFNYQSNREILRILEEQGITDIAVVDKNMKFSGFTNRELITSRIINNLMIKAE